MFNTTKSYLEEKKILILGLGREGLSTYKFVRHLFPDIFIAFSDKKQFKDLEPKYLQISKKDKHVNFILGSNYLDTLTEYEVVIKSPGIPNKLKEIKEAKKAGVIFTSQTKIFFDECKGIIVGVTGTKGKSTTTTLIHHFLKKAGKKAVLLGNIGKPPLDYLDEDSRFTYYVFEMSSHQLSDLNKSPHVAVLLNVFREHLDYYESFKEYFDAKKNITKFQKKGDFLILNYDSLILREVLNETRAKVLSFSLNEKMDAYIDNDTCFIKNGGIIEALITTKDIKLIGGHNLYNIMAAALASISLGVSLDVIRKAIISFKPLPVRLETVGKYKGITFILDALATIPEATIAALNSYKGQVGTLICGGFDRGQNFKELAKEIIKEKVDNLVLFPTTGQKIWKEIIKLQSINPPKHFLVMDMATAVKTSYDNTPKGKICLLSAASSSFSLFKNYEEESALFRKYVMQLSKPKK